MKAVEKLLNSLNEQKQFFLKIFKLSEEIKKDFLNIFGEKKFIDENDRIWIIDTCGIDHDFSICFITMRMLPKTILGKILYFFVSSKVYTIDIFLDLYKNGYFKDYKDEVNN